MIHFQALLKEPEVIAWLQKQQQKKSDEQKSKIAQEPTNKLASDSQWFKFSIWCFRRE